MSMIFYAVKTSDGMWEFNKALNPNSMSVSESVSFIKENLVTYPNMRDVKVYDTEDSWKKAQNL